MHIPSMNEIRVKNESKMCKINLLTVSNIATNEFIFILSLLSGQKQVIMYMGVVRNSGN